MVGLVVAASGQSAGAYNYTIAENKLGWSQCSWKYRNPSNSTTPGNVYYYISTASGYSFPADSTSPDIYAVRQSFRDRIVDAFARWNGVLGNVKYRLRFVESAWFIDYMVQYYDTDPYDPLLLGRTDYMRSGDSSYRTREDLAAWISGCPNRTPGQTDMWYVRIRIDPRNDWFTQDDSRRSTWEKCSDPSFRAQTTAAGSLKNDYLCGKLYDFGSTVTHEIGHGLLLYHPQDLDWFDGVLPTDSSSASRIAKCFVPAGSYLEQATMCKDSGPWRTEKRTLDTWDGETINKHHDKK